MQKLIIAALLLYVATFPVAAKETSYSKKYQSVFLASFIDGMCRGKERSGLTTMSISGVVSTAPPIMTEEEKSRCEYVRAGLATKCFESGTCPSYKDWLRAGAKH